MKRRRQGVVKIVFTGGHAATTAGALAEEINFRAKNWQLYFLGSDAAFEGKKAPTLESEFLPTLGVKFLPLKTGRLQRKFTLYTIPSLFKIPLGFIQGFYYLLKIGPNLVFSFGGYASVPVCLAAKILRIPVVIHEQTSVVGRATLITAKIAKKIAISRIGSFKYLPKEKCVLTGNPVMKEILEVRPKDSLSKTPTIYITGGSRGSQIINKAIESVLPELLPKFKIIHQTGELDYPKFSLIKNKNYLVYKRVDPNKLKDIYDKADLIISRAGANTVSEIMIVKRPAILIPLPHNYLDEQTKNAEAAVEFGIAKILPQHKLTKETLIQEIERIIKNYAKIIKHVRDKRSQDIEAAGRIFDLLRSLLK